MISCKGDYIEKISENVLDTSFDDFDPATLKNVKNRLLDVIGCLISGADGPGNLAILNLVKAWGGKEEATILVHGGKAPAHNVAMVNSIMARSYDFEPVSAFVDGVELASHISATTILTALALGEAEEINGKELITAILIGDDIACRVLAASGFGFTQGWDGNGTVNMFGATATAGRILKLTESQMQNAFGIALNQMSGSFQNIWDGTLCFKLPQGLSARNGIISAELAKAGWNGPKDALFGNFGYFTLYTRGCTNHDILIKDLGKKYYTEATFKPYPCCRATHTAIDCALDIVNKNDIDINKIEKIILKVPTWVREMVVAQPLKIREIPQIDAAFNIRFCVANVLLRKNITLEHFKENLVKDPEITSLVNKITIEEIEDYDEQKQFCSNLKITMKDGQEFFTKIDYTKGDPVVNPLSFEEIKEKFMNNLAYSQTRFGKNGEKIILLIESLEDVNNISDLIKLVS